MCRSCETTETTRQNRAGLALQNGMMQVMRLRRLARSFGPFVLMTFATIGACSTTSSSASPAVHASQFNQRCTSDLDCMAIFDGAGCCGGCPNAAINKADQASYEQADKARTACNPVPPCVPLECAGVIVTCQAGICGSSTCASTGCPDASASEDASGE